jgi:hypothetical protein
MQNALIIGADYNESQEVFDSCYVIDICSSALYMCVHNALLLGANHYES